MIVDANAQVGQYPFAADAHQISMAESEQGLTGKEHEQSEQYPLNTGLDAGQHVPGKLATEPGNSQCHTGLGQHQETSQRQLYTVGRREAEKETQVHGSHGKRILPYPSR